MGRELLQTSNSFQPLLPTRRHRLVGRDKAMLAQCSGKIGNWGGMKSVVGAYQSCARNCMIAASIFLAGCSLMPASGPASIDVAPLVPDSRPYAFVKITRALVDVLARYTPSFSNAFADRRPPNDFHFGVGDIVSVTILSLIHI